MFGTRGDVERTAAVRALKRLAARLFDAGDEDVVVVNELTCSEPGCPPLETVIALLRAGESPRQIKIHKPLFEVGEEDLRAALLAADDHEAPAR